MKCAEVQIVNKLGMHARASAKLVNLAAEFKCEILLGRNGRRVNAKSIMGIMMLAAGKGSVVELCTDGHDEDRAMEALTMLIANRFGEDE